MSKELSYKKETRTQRMNQPSAERGYRAGDAIAQGCF